jgi:hypothetical protein
VRSFKIGLLIAFSSLAAHAETADRALTAQVNGKIQGQAAVIQIDPPKGTHLNYDGPWRLQVTGPLKLKNENGQYGIDAFNKEKRSFTLPLAGKPDSAEFKLAYFLCSDDNVWCKRVEAKGEIK